MSLDIVKKHLRREALERSDPGINLDEAYRLAPIHEALVGECGESDIDKFIDQYGVEALPELDRYLRMYGAAALPYYPRDPQAAEYPTDHLTQDSGGGPDVDLGTTRNIDPIYQGLVSAYGRWVIDKYVEKHGANALLEFPQDETVHPIDRLARGLIPDAPNRETVVDVLDTARGEPDTPTEGDQESVSWMHSDRAADY